jgi:cytochrome c
MDFGFAIVAVWCGTGAGRSVGSCLACHSEAADAPGPSLKGIVGRSAASLPDFRYSGPLRRSGIVWDEAKLRAFVTDPQSVVPGTRMPYAGTSPQEAARITAALIARDTSK